MGALIGILGLGCREDGASSRTPSPHRLARRCRCLGSSRATDRHYHAPPSRNSVSEGNLTA
eukprot:652916-Prymnesium_polylepis.1